MASAAAEAFNAALQGARQGPPTPAGNEGLFPTIKQAPRNGYEYAAALGLGTPERRAVAGAALATVVCYALKFPAHCFKDNGQLKKFDVEPQYDEDDVQVTQYHFAAVPIVAAIATYYLI